MLTFKFTSQYLLHPKFKKDFISNIFFRIFLSDGSGGY